MAKPKHTTRALGAKFIAVAVLVCLIVMAVVLYAGGTSPGFQEYKPTALPADLSITGAELYIQKYPKLLPSFDKHINLNFNLANSWIEENKSDGMAFYNSWCQNYQQGSPCHQYQSPRHQQFLLATYTTNSEGELGQQVYFIKGGTSIDARLTKYRQLSPQSWGKLIDSFQPTRYDHPKIFRGSTQGP